MLARGGAGLEPDDWNAWIIISFIRMLTLRQERLDLFMGVPMRDCCHGQLQVEDVGVQQPILHHRSVQQVFVLLC